MRISDWSSDVCSSDLFAVIRGRQGHMRVPIAGRVSMDLITLDVSAVPDGDCRPGDAVDLIGGGVDIDEQAATAGTIAYELLRSEEHTSELQSLMRISYAVFCLKNKNKSAIATA